MNSFKRAAKASVLLLCSLLFVQCASDGNKTSAEAAAGTDTKGKANVEMKIAYVDGDSLMSGYNFAKDAPALELKCGVVEGTYYDEKAIGVIATIPSREVLISKFLGSIQSPITNFARVIKQIAEKDTAEA